MTTVLAGVAVLSVIGGQVMRAQAPQAPQGRGRGAGAGAPTGTPPAGGDQAGRGGRGGGRGAAPAQRDTPDLNGIWNGGGGARPVNSESQPWTKDNFPVLNERGLAYQKVLTGRSHRSDCVPASSPAIITTPTTCSSFSGPIA
jgi:hypothetical protein